MNAPVIGRPLPGTRVSMPSVTEYPGFTPKPTRKDAPNDPKKR